MLESLTIRNFGIIEQATVTLFPGLNVLTGETGAGKSILIEALRFCLGERFQATSLRDGADSCMVETVWRLTPAVRASLPDPDLAAGSDPEMILQRTVSADGKSRARLNGMTITLSQMKAIGDTLLDLHGPHDHQQLLAEDRHLAIIDALTNHDGLLETYAAMHRDLLAATARLNALKDLARSRERDLDLVTHQIRELEQVPLSDEDASAAAGTMARINNAAKLYENAARALGALENDEAGVERLLASASGPLHTIASLDEEATGLVDTLSEAQDRLQSLLSALRSYADGLAFDPGEAKTAADRADAYDAIRRKYGPTLADARAFLANAKEQFSLLANIEQNETDLQDRIQELTTSLTEQGKKISRARRKTSALLTKTIEQELKDLGFKTVSFEVRFETVPPGPRGLDKAVFFISTNAGESLKPLAEIVSSGEAARLMLAIKRALMKVDPVPVLVFDEIDAQIGGRLGSVIGAKLQEIARHRQVVLITHLPQIAACADRHLKIDKSVRDGRTGVTVTLLDGNNRIAEIAHMMSGDAMTPVSLRHAKELLSKAVA